MIDYISIIIQSLTILFLFFISYFLIRLSIMLKKEKRLSKFTTPVLQEKRTSFFDKFETLYVKLIDFLSKFNNKSIVLKNYSKKYEKYIDQSKKDRKSAMDFISNKFVVAFTAILITIVSDSFNISSFSLLQLVIVFIVGFFIPDIFLSIELKRKRKQIENDMLKAVTIMNNAFKSGRSVMQVVDLVSKEIDGPISEEFKKMYIDLTFGLELEVVFKRFADRIKLDEVNYMASSLVILNKTGGNVVKVFNTIEKGFFDRRKLKEEMKSALALSNLVFKILISLPIVIVLFIYLFNNNYFMPLIETSVGRILLAIAIVIYVSYIILVRCITKLKE